MYKSVIFDFDGTICDTGEGIKKSAKYALDAFNIPSDDWQTLDCFIGPPLLVTFQEQFNQRLKEIFKLLANPDSYPIYIHCWAGADRTGTVIALLKSALGVSFHDITRDFEISTFAKFGVRGRCNKDFTYVEVFEHLKNNYPGASLKAQARAFLIDRVGLEQKDLHNIEQILLEY